MIEAVQLAVYRMLPRRLKVLGARIATPNFTVGTIGLITRDGTDLLLVRPSYRRGWLPPGGFVGKREEPEATLRREIEEELGVAMEFAPPHRVAFDVRRQGVTFVSVGVAPLGAEFRVRTRELKAMQWFPLGDLPPMPNDFFEGLPDDDLEAIRAIGGAQELRPR
ncbi:MAG: hydrolase [Frankiales bacterium]|nr:hydrolase [Frankiales bacterium]